MTQTAMAEHDTASQIFERVTMRPFQRFMSTANSSFGNGTTLDQS